MQLWAKRGLRTALVTGGLLMLGTGIASATGPSQAPANKEIDSVNDMYTTAGDNPVTAANWFTDTATTSGGNVRTSGEWGALSGDLENAPGTDITQAASGASVFRVPVDVLGRAVESGHHAVPVADDDVPPPVWSPAGMRREQQKQAGPSVADSLLRADQVPGLGGPFGRPAVPPMSPMEMTRAFPVLSDGMPDPAAMDLTQQLPALATELTQQFPRLSTTEPTRQVDWPRPWPGNGGGTPGAPRTTPYQPYHPMAGELPVSGALSRATAPARKPVAPNLSGLPDLPPVPTLPAMPPLPSRPGPQAAPAAPAVPTPHLGTPQVPAGTAAQLMAQLRGLISELESSGGGRQLHSMNVTAPQEPPRR
jgi:hypothetical protein